MSKKLIILLSLLGLIIACNSGMESDAMKNTEAAESEIPVATDGIEKMEESAGNFDVAINYKVIVREKLMELADLRNLMKEHPEFQTDLASQLSNISTDSLLLNEKDIIEISGLRILENTIVNDSLAKIKLDFNIETPTHTRRDSLIALFRFNTIELDGRTFNSTKVTFERLTD